MDNQEILKLAFENGTLLVTLTKNPGLILSFQDNMQHAKSCTIHNKYDLTFFYAVKYIIRNYTFEVSPFGFGKQLLNPE